MSKNETPLLINYFNVDKKTIVIHFDELFKKPDLSQYNIFKLSFKSKRFYADTAPIFCTGCNEVLSLNREIAEDFLYQYLNIKKAIDEGKLKNKNTFINLLTTNLFLFKRKNNKKAILDLIKEYVDINFINHIDPYYEKNLSKYEQSIMFFERHYKLLFHMSALSKFTIPLCIHFLYNNPNIDTDVDSFIYLIMMELIQIVINIENNENINIYSKLYRHIEKFMDRISVSDSAGLERLEIYGYTVQSIIEMVIKKLLTNILPKYEFNKDIMKFNQSVLRSSVEDYTLRKKDEFPAYCIINDEESFGDEDKDGLDIFTRYNRTKDEKTIIYRSVLSSITIDKIAERYQIIINPNELKYYNENLEINSLQILLLTQIFSKEFEGVENIYGCSKLDIVKGIIILHKRMLKLNLINLANLIIAKKVNTILSKYQMKSLIKKIQSNETYKKIIKYRYSYIKDLFETKIISKSDKKHPIIELMKLIMNENYIYNGLNDPENGILIPKNEDIILDEVLNLYIKLII